MTLVLDSGALIALERGDRAMWRRLKLALLSQSIPVTHGGVVGQVWRGQGPRQALLSRALGGVAIQALDANAGLAAGELLLRARKRDVIDAALVLLARDGDTILTSDPHDLATLARAAQLHVEIVPV